MSNVRFFIYCDGSRTGAGVVAYDETGEEVFHLTEPVSLPTHHHAEYMAVKLGLERLLAEGATTVHVRSDSRLVIGQLWADGSKLESVTYAWVPRRRWKCNAPGLPELRDQVLALAAEFENVTFEWVPRELNRVADRVSRA